MDMLDRFPLRRLHFIKRLKLDGLETTLRNVGGHELLDSCAIASVVSTGLGQDVLKNDFLRYLRVKDAALVLEDNGWTCIFIPPAKDGMATRLLRQFSVPVAPFTAPFFAAPVLLTGRFVLQR